MHACGAHTPPSLRMCVALQYRTGIPSVWYYSVVKPPAITCCCALPSPCQETITKVSTADSFTPCCKKTPGIFAAQLQAPPPKLKVSLALPMPCQSPTQVTATAALPIAGSRIAVPCRRYGSSMSCKAKAPSPPPLQPLHCMLRSSGTPAKAEVELGQAAPTACRVPAAAAGVPAASTLLCG